MAGTVVLAKKAVKRATNGSSKNGESKPTPKAVIIDKPTLNIDEKIQKVSDLNDLITKRNRFLESKLKLNSFNLKREDTTTRLNLVDNEGNQFVTSHTGAIAKVLELLNQSIENGLSETEAKIQF